MTTGNAWGQRRSGRYGGIVPRDGGHFAASVKGKPLVNFTHAHAQLDFNMAKPPGAVLRPVVRLDTKASALALGCTGNWG